MTPLKMSMFTCLLSVLAVPVTAGELQPVTQSDVFLSGREGYHTYRIPVVLVTKTGTLLAFCEGRKDNRRDHGDLDLVLKRSSDSGKTWGPLELVYEEGGDRKITIGNPCPVVDQSTGAIWLPFCRDNDDVLITHSTDDGRSWSKPVEITKDVKKPGWGWYATGPGVGIQLQRGLHKGRLVIPCDHRVGEGRDEWNSQGHSHVIYSDNHGKSWKLGGITGSGMNECQVVELADGTLMLNMRSYRGKKRRAVSLSKDGGLTWSEPVDDPTLIEPVCQASLLRYSLKDPGADRNRLLFSNPASESKRHRMTLRLSFDEGRTWPKSKLVYAGSAAYSCLTVLPDGKIGLLFERDDYARITFSVYSLKQLTGEDDSVKKR